jgi:hypothetical protein
MRFVPGRLAGVARLSLAMARLRLRELRNFYRYPRRLRFARTGGAGLRVVLYGIPFDDWNQPLTSPELWEGIEQVAEVVRVPGSPLFAPADGRPTVFIPMKDIHATHLPRGSRALAPDRTSIAFLADKGRFASYLALAALSNYRPLHYPDAAHAVFPCVVKRVDLSASVGVAVARSRAHLDEILADTIFHGHPYLLQELVPGHTECVACFVCRQGKVLWDCTFETDMDGPAIVKHEGSGRNRRQIDTPPEVIAAVEEVLVPLDYDGFCVIDYKVPADGEAKILEINPRLGGTLLRPEHLPQLREAISCMLAAV